MPYIIHGFSEIASSGFIFSENSIRGRTRTFGNMFCREAAEAHTGVTQVCAEPSAVIFKQGASDFLHRQEAVFRADAAQCEVCKNGVQMMEHSAGFFLL